VSESLGRVPFGQHTGLPDGATMIRLLVQQTFGFEKAIDAAQNSPLPQQSVPQHLPFSQQRPSPQFSLPLGQHFPREQTSVFFLQHLLSPHLVSSFPHLHLPSSHGCWASQHVTVLVVRLLQHWSRGGQHLATAPPAPAAPATLQRFQVFTQHMLFAGLTHVSLSSQHPFPHTLSESHLTHFSLTQRSPSLQQPPLPHWKAFGQQVFVVAV